MKYRKTKPSSHQSNLRLVAKHDTFVNSMCIIEKGREGQQSLGRRVIAGNDALVAPDALGARKDRAVPG